MVPFLSLLSWELSVAVKDNPDKKTQKNYAALQAKDLFNTIFQPREEYESPLDPLFRLLRDV